MSALEHGTGNFVARQLHPIWRTDHFFPKLNLTFFMLLDSIAIGTLRDIGVRVCRVFAEVRVRAAGARYSGPQCAYMMRPTSVALVKQGRKSGS